MTSTLRILQLALEETRQDNNAQPTEAVQGVKPVAPAEMTVELTGPLSQVYTDALNLVLAKAPNTDSAGKIEGQGIETQQIDAAIMGELSDQFKKDEVSPTDTFQTVYGVSRDEVTEDTIVDVTQRLAKKDYKGDYIIIADYCQGSKIGTVGNADYYLSNKMVDISRPAMTQDQEVRNQTNNIWYNTLESIAYAYGVPVYHSLKEYLQSTI